MTAMTTAVTQGAGRGTSMSATWQPCSKESEPCRFWQWGKDALRPPCCTAHLLELLAFTEALLTRHGLFHWLDFGSLLGAVREQQLIAWDGDVDFGILRSDLKKFQALEAEIRAHGYYPDTSASFMYRIQYSKTNTTHVDLFPWWREGELYKMVWPYEEPTQWFFPVRFLDTLTTVYIEGNPFPAPAPVDEFLANYRYGPTYLTPRRYYSADGITDLAAQEKRNEKAVQAEQQRTQFIHNLQLLNDVLATTPLAAHYWLWGGVLLGWAREGAVLKHDAKDADFGYFAEEHDKFLAALPALYAAGFQPLRQWRNSAGDTTEYVLHKDGAVFDFFEFQRRGERAAYWLYVETIRKKAWIELYGEVPLSDFTTMHFLARTWRKPCDHEAFLTAIYGDWRTPNPRYNYATDEKSIVRKTLWVGRGEPVIYVPPGQPDFSATEEVQS